jgi:hypothetical protein
VAVIDLEAFDVQNAAEGSASNGLTSLNKKSTATTLHSAATQGSTGCLALGLIRISRTKRHDDGIVRLI